VRRVTQFSVDSWGYEFLSNRLLKEELFGACAMREKSGVFMRLWDFA